MIVIPSFPRLDAVSLPSSKNTTLIWCSASWMRFRFKIFEGLYKCYYNLRLLELLCLGLLFSLILDAWNEATNSYPKKRAKTSRFVEPLVHKRMIVVRCDRIYVVVVVNWKRYLLLDYVYYVRHLRIIWKRTFFILEQLVQFGHCFEFLLRCL